MANNNIDEFRESYNERFGCCICLSPKLKMVTATCQHRLCVDCLYVGTERRPCMQNCPICSYRNSFPKKRPIIPETSIEMQQCIGVQECPNKCSTELWFWEVDEHIKTCPKNKKIKVSEKESLPVKKKSKSKKSFNVQVNLRETRRSTVMKTRLQSRER